MSTPRPATAVGIIPARYGSTRLPGKVLEPVGGVPLICMVCDSAGRSRRLDRVIVATDDRRVADAVAAHGWTAVMTSPSHRSGSDRVAEAAASIDCGIVVNIQGDEPLIRGEAIDAAVEALLADPSLGAATLATPFDPPGEADDPNAVKVVRNLRGDAIYFSRARIPYARGIEGGRGPALKHIGLYGYRKEFLLRFTGWSPTALEKAEGLEQLRILEHGERIRVVETRWDSVSVDTAEDLERVRAIVASRK